MKWVYENAANFGGDNTRITIAGQSAGSWSVGYHLLHEPSWKYFRNAILHSGNPLEPGSKRMQTTEQATTQAVNIGKKLGCFNTNQNITNLELFNCMQSAKVNATKYYSSFYWYYPPIVRDGIEFTDDPETLFKEGKMKRCNILTGSNTKERAYFEKEAIKDPQSYQSRNLTSDLTNPSIDIDYQ